MFGKKIETLKRKCPTCSSKLQINLLEGDGLESEIVFCPTCKIEIDDDESFVIIEEQNKKKFEKREKRNRKEIRGIRESWMD